jgi:uncharacterized protein (DUF362 family)
VEFKLNDKGEWKLSNYTIKVKLQSIDKVEIIKTSSFPTQVFLKVSGIHARCQDVGEFRYELEGKHFNVTIYSTMEEKDFSLYLCADMVREFSKVIQLPVLFLEKGSYTYTVNDDLSGTFELPSDNDIPSFRVID